MLCISVVYCILISTPLNQKLAPLLLAAMSDNGRSREKNQSREKDEKTSRAEGDGTVKGVESRQEPTASPRRQTLPLDERLLSVLQELSERIKPVQEQTERRAALKGKGRKSLRGERKRDDEQAPSDLEDVHISNGSQEIGNEGSSMVDARGDQVLDVDRGPPELPTNVTPSPVTREAFDRTTQIMNIKTRTS
jgi:hypothetical protein